MARMQIRAFQIGESYGVEKYYPDAPVGAPSRAGMHGAAFSKEAAERIAEMEASDNPPRDWKEIKARLNAAGLTDEQIFPGMN